MVSKFSAVRSTLPLRVSKVMKITYREKYLLAKVAHACLLDFLPTLRVELGRLLQIQPRSNSFKK